MSPQHLSEILDILTVGVGAGVPVEAVAAKSVYILPYKSLRNLLK